MSPEVQEDAESTAYVLMYACKNDQCPKSVWINSQEFTVKESKCSSCKVICTPLHVDDVSFLLFCL